MTPCTPGFPVLHYIPEFAQTHAGFLRSLWTREEGASQKEWLSPSAVCPQGDQTCLFFLNQSSLGPGLCPSVGGITLVGDLEELLAGSAICDFSAWLRSPSQAPMAPDNASSWRFFFD